MELLTAEGRYYGSVPFPTGAGGSRGAGNLVSQYREGGEEGIPGTKSISIGVEIYEEENKDNYDRREGILLCY